MAAQAPGSAESDVIETLRRKLVEFSLDELPGDAIDPDRHMFDHGYLDSLTSVELLAFIKTEYGVEVPEVELIGPLATLSALGRHVAREAR